MSCENNHLETAKWLHSLGIHTYNEHVFRVVCLEGHLEIAKWLHSQGASIHVLNDEAFRLSCENNHLKTAQWLYSRGANIHLVNAYSFFIERPEIARWLATIFQEKFQISESNGRLSLFFRPYNYPRSYNYPETSQPVECIVCTYDRICYQLPCCYKELCRKCLQQLEYSRCPNCRRHF